MSKAKKKPDLPALDPLESALETARCAQEGNRKLSLAVDMLREGLERVAHAEYDHQTGTPVSAQQLREIAAETMDAYSRHTGQNWRLAKNKVVHTRAGDRSLNNIDG